MSYVTEASTMVAVKEERPDEAEIRELAEKMKEANKAKMSAPTPVGRMLSSGVGGQTTLTGFLARTPAAVTVPPQTNVSKAAEDKKPIDEESQRGRFGWSVLNTIPIPYILREGEKFCAVRMIENKLLNKYLSFLHSDIYNYTNVRSYYITDAEARVLNEINVRHCDFHYGREHFLAGKDHVVRLQDAGEFVTYLDVCFNKLNQTPATGCARCGFIRINDESVVPYTVKDNVKYVPLFYFEGETESLKLKAETLEGWDLAYLKFCCKVQGIRNELFASETCSVISLNDIMSYFPAPTKFADYWPTKVTDCQLLSKNPVANNGKWTKQTANHAPPISAAKPATAQPRSFPPTLTPPAAGTPGASAAALPTSMWSIMQQQQQQQQQEAVRQYRIAQASQVDATSNQRFWQQAKQVQPAQRNQNYMQSRNMQMQPGKSLPPPLVRNPSNPNQPMMTPERAYSLQKNLGMRSSGMATANGTVNGFPRADVMNLSGSHYVNNTNGKDSGIVQIEDVMPTGHTTPYQVQC